MRRKRKENNCDGDLVRYQDSITLIGNFFFFFPAASSPLFLFSPPVCVGIGQVGRQVGRQRQIGIVGRSALCDWIHRSGCNRLVQDCDWVEWLGVWGVEYIHDVGT